MRDNFCDVAKLTVAMNAAGMAAVVAASPNSVFHMSGSLIITHVPIRDRLAFCITTGSGRQCLAVCKIEASLCEHDSWVSDIRTYIEFKELPSGLLARTLMDLGLNGQTVGIELGYLREAYFRELRASAPSIRFVPCDDVLEESRMVKGAAQIDRMAESGRATTRALRDVVPLVGEGKTERELRIAMRRALARNGADGSYVLVASGPHTVVGGHRATERRLASGDVVVVDAAATFDGYAAEAAWSVAVGTGAATTTVAQAAGIYRAAGIALRAGIAGREVYIAAAEAARKAGGSLAVPLAGYGISYGGQERPYLAANSRDVLQPGTVIALDIDYRQRDDCAARFKGMWAIEATRARELTDRI